VAKTELHYCNNCGRRIQSHQSKLEIKIKHGQDYYHETWQGCYESTRESGRFVSTELDKELIKITPIY
jgi:predicted transcriptional regulator YheO